MKRPISVTMLGFLFIVAGLVGVAYHLCERPADPAIVLITFIRIVAVVGGVFLLRGHSWARWLLVGWLAFHVVSALHSLSEMAAHGVLLIVVAYFLFTPPAAKYFQPAPPG
jgi:hypothetical protein